MLLPVIWKTLLLTTKKCFLFKRVYVVLLKCIYEDFARPPDWLREFSWVLEVTRENLDTYPGFELLINRELLGGVDVGIVLSDNDRQLTSLPISVVCFALPDFTVKSSRPCNIFIRSVLMKSDNVLINLTWAYFWIGTCFSIDIFWVFLITPFGRNSMWSSVHFKTSSSNIYLIFDISYFPLNVVALLPYPTFYCLVRGTWSLCDKHSFHQAHQVRFEIIGSFSDNMNAFVNGVAGKNIMFFQLLLLRYIAAARLQEEKL